MAEISTFPINAISFGAHGRKLDRTDNGNLWALIRDGGSNRVEAWYSDDDGDTWTEDGNVGDSAFDESPSFFIDVDDYAHALCRDGDNYRYFRGTPNAGRTSWTWSSALSITGLANAEPPSNIVAHKEGTGWKAHFLWSRYFTTGQLQLGYVRIDITSGGTISVDHTEDIFAVNNPVLGIDSYGVIDFNHTGDGKTVSGSTPHLYIFYSQPEGTANEMQFKKMTYSAGTWTQETARPIDSAGYAYNALISGAFDGSRMVMAYVHHNAVTAIKIAERNAADTSTDTRTPTALSDGTIRSLGVSYDGEEDIHLWAVGDTSKDVMRLKYDRSADSWDSSWTTVSTGTAFNQSMTLKLGYSGSHIDAMWHDDDGATPYPVDSLHVSLNQAPTAPTIDSPASGSTQDVAEVLPIDWTFNDPDEGDTQGAYSLRKQIGTGSYSYWNGSVFTATEDASTKISSAGTIHTLSASWGSDSDANHKYAIKTWDAADDGPSAWTETTVTPSAQDNPTVTAITTVTGPTYDVVWTVSTQTKYQVKVYADSGGSPVTSSSFYDSGVQVSTVSSHTTPFPDNNVTRHVGVTTWNDEGLQSDEDTEQLEVDYEAPPTPTVANSTTGTESAAIFVNVTNPSPGAGETTTDSNEIYRRVAADGGDGIRVATGVASSGAYTDWGPLSEVVYQYRARAINTGNGTGTYGAWTT